MEYSGVSSRLFIFYCMCQDDIAIGQGLADFLTLISTIQKIEFKTEGNQSTT